MPEVDLRAFEHHLLRSGIHSRHAHRAAIELAEHLEDLAEEARRGGAGPAEARAIALERIGEFDVIAAHMQATRELKAWPFRYPRLARLWLPVAYVMLLPATPVIAGIQHAPSIARWAACAMAGALVTAAMLLMLQLLILFA